VVSCSANFFVQAEQGKDYKGHGDMEGRRGHLILMNNIPLAVSLFLWEVK
jgi:hypothetical protein